MKVLIFEDDKSKFELISNELMLKGIKENHIVRIESVAEYVRLANNDFDLCVIDLRMPGLVGGVTSSAGGEILQMLDYSGKKRIPVLAITAYEDEANQYRESFSARGCMIFNIDQKHLWSQALDIFIAQAQDRNRYDFIIFSALSEERHPFAEIDGLKIQSVTRQGVDHWDCDFDDTSGSIVLLPRMGLVNAAATVARVLANYSPKVVAMSGICGGINKQAKLGQLLVTDICWEYQSGKWLADIQKSEPYQVSVPHNTRTFLAKMLENSKLLNALESGFTGDLRPAQRTEPTLAVFTSGSAVIASEDRLQNVEQQHRKVAGIDMEVFGFHRAVELSGQQLHSFSAKVVVDKADEKKADDLHAYGSFVSAQFTILAVKELLKVRA